MFIPQHIDTFIEDITNTKKTVVETMDSVLVLMREVVREEKAAKIAKEEADRCCLSIFAKVDQLKKAQQLAKETNDMLAREAYVQKHVLATKSEVLQLQAARLLDNGDRSLDLLYEMHRALETRLTAALLEKDLAIKNKQEYEASARAALAYEESQMVKVEEEFKRLKQEAVKISKLQDFLIDRGHMIDMLRGEILDKCQDVKLLKDELDQVIPPGGITSSSQKSSIAASSSSSIVHCQPHTQIKGEDSGPNEVFETGIKVSNGVKGKLRGKGMFARSIKKVKIKGKLYGSRLFAKRVKKVKMKVKSKLVGKGMCAKSIKKVKINGKLHRNQMCAKSRKKVSVKGKLHGSRMCAKSTKKAKIKARPCVTRMFAKRIKKGELKDKLHESRMFSKRINKLKIM